MMTTITDSSVKRSSELAREYGVFAAWKRSKWYTGYEKYPQKMPIRNVSTTTIPPTGTTCMIPGVSSGCEPNFCLSFEYKHILDGKTTLQNYNPHLNRALKEYGYWTEAIERKITVDGGFSSLTQEEVPDSFREIFCTAMTITGKDHLAMLIALQECTMNAVSKTINLSNDTTEEDIEKVYMDAYNKGCKGLAVYRDGSRTVQVLNKGSEEKPNEENDIQNIDGTSSIDHTDDRMGDMKCRTRNCPGPVIRHTPTCFVCTSCQDEGCSKR
jgi:ribonucleoside-diphosphate reductase alpha chain